MPDNKLDISARGPSCIRIRATRPSLDSTRGDQFLSRAAYEESSSIGVVGAAVRLDESMHLHFLNACHRGVEPVTLNSLGKTSYKKIVLVHKLDIAARG